VTRRLTVEWPDGAPFRNRSLPIRFLAVSDEPDRTLEHEVNRRNIGHLDAILSCGDLEPDWLSFLGDAFSVPLVRVLGNHDRDHPDLEQVVPHPLRASVTSRFPVPLVGLSWAGEAPVRGDRSAWAQALRITCARLLRPGAVLVASHVPPTGAGDGPDPYHRGYDAYRWLVNRLRPPLWLHGHTTLASTENWQAKLNGTLVVNVTGSVLVELVAPQAASSIR